MTAVGPGLADARGRDRSALTTFGLLWVAHTVSLLGTKLTDFGLGVWAIQTTGSTTSFALIGVAATLPGVLLAPVVGALVDRWDRRHALILGDLGAGLCTAVIAVLVATGKLETWHIYPIVAVSSAFDALQVPAFLASVPDILRRRHLGRANGFTQLGAAGVYILAPGLAGFLIGTIGLAGVIALDVATFLFAIAVVAALRFPRRSAVVPRPGPFLAGAGHGWAAIRSDRGLFALLGVSAASTFTMAFATVLFTPLVLAMADPVVLGLVLSVAGFGMLTGSLTMSVWGGPRDKVAGIVAFAGFQGLMLLFGAFRPDPAWVGVAAFGFLFAAPLLGSCELSLWQSRVEPGLLGRVLSVRRAAQMIATPAAYLAAGPLADRVFEPLVSLEGGAWADLGHLLGGGPGRGIAALLALSGVVSWIWASAAFSYRPLRQLAAAESSDAEPGRSQS